MGHLPTSLRQAEAVRRRELHEAAERQQQQIRQQVRAEHGE
jgi:hypothetical protein